MSVSFWDDEYWWVKQRTIAEVFGVPDPDKVMAQVNEICATRLDGLLDD